MYQETMIQNSLITNTKLRDRAYRCYNLLLSMAYVDKVQIYHSKKYLATALGKSVRTMQRYLK